MPKPTDTTGASAHHRGESKTTMTTRTFAAAVRRHRAALGISRELLAERADVSVDYIRRVEVGAVSPTIRYA